MVHSRADLRWVTRSPSMESRTRTSPKFGKTNIVSQFAFHLIFVLLQLLCMLSVYIVISSMCLQFGLKIEIERSKFGATLQKPCIPDTSDVHTGHVRYFLPVLNIFILCSNFVLQGCNFYIYSLYLVYSVANL